VRVSSRVSWIVQPWEAVGPITRGMTRAEVRSKVHSRFEPFLKGDAVTTTDAFDDLGVHCYYSTQDLIEYVQCQSTFGSVVLTLDGLSLSGSWTNTLATLRKRGFVIEQPDDESAIARELGLHFWTMDPSDDQITSVSALFVHDPQ
jgi:hypothetical protein